MGSQLALSSPANVEALFSYSVEVWRSCDNFIESVLGVGDDSRDSGHIFIVKTFPFLFVLSENGKFEVAAGSEMDESIKRFCRECSPLDVDIKNEAISSVPELLRVDEEEGLEGYLKEIGLEVLCDDLMRLRFG
jgi:hypothetical protein